MVICSARTAGDRILEITEPAPTDSYTIGKTFIIKITIHAILEITVVHPCIGYFFEAKQVVSIAVICSGSNKSDITNNEIVETFYI